MHPRTHTHFSWTKSISFCCCSLPWTARTLELLWTFFIWVAWKSIWVSAMECSLRQKWNLFFGVLWIFVEKSSKKWVEMKQKGGFSELVVGKVVIVAVKASKEIPRSALVWALTHVVQPGDYIKLLVVMPPLASSNILILFFVLIKCSQFCAMILGYMCESLCFRYSLLSCLLYLVISHATQFYVIFMICN